jgi:hypothetical protein
MSKIHPELLLGSRFKTGHGSKPSALDLSKRSLAALASAMRIVAIPF